jgi:hypothetical protein
MPSVRNSTAINAAPQRVWDMVTALRYLPLWLANVAAVSAISMPEAAAGTKFELTRPNSALPEAWIVAEWQPLQLLRLTACHHDLHWIAALEPVAQGMQVALEYRWPQRGLAARILPPTAQRRLVERSLSQLKELIDFNRDIALLHGIGDE